MSKFSEVAYQGNPKYAEQNQSEDQKEREQGEKPDKDLIQKPPGYADGLGGNQFEPPHFPLHRQDIKGTKQNNQGQQVSPHKGEIELAEELFNRAFQLPGPPFIGIIEVEYYLFVVAEQVALSMAIKA